MKTSLAFVSSLLMMYVLASGRSNATTSHVWSDWVSLTLAIFGSALGSGLVFFLTTKFSPIKAESFAKYAVLVSLIFAAANGVYWATGSYTVFLIHHDATRRWSGFLVILALLSAVMLVATAFIIGIRRIDLLARKSNR